MLDWRVSASGGDRETAAGVAATAGVEALGAHLRRLRRRAGLSREQLSERAGFSVATILALELGRRTRPYPHTLRALAEALGLAPEDRAALLAAEERDAPPAPAAAPASRLPVWPTALVGRDADIGAVRDLLDPASSQVRLLSLVGPGGVGKTRLVVAAAAALARLYPDGVVFVDLAPLRDERLVPATIAHALGVHEAGGRGARERLLEHLRARQSLLVLDNLEHLLAAAPCWPSCWKVARPWRYLSPAALRCICAGSSASRSRRW